MINKKVRWGIIGLGKIAHKFAEDLLLSENAVLEAVASRSEEKANKFKEQFRAQKAYASYSGLINDPNIDVVYIATPHVFHFELSMQCMEAGKAVLCEKPLAMNQKEVKSMIECSRKNSVFLLEAMWTRFIPATEKLIELLESKLVGKLKLLKADFGFKANYDPYSRLFNKSLGGGALLDIGIYPVFLSLLTLGIPDNISAHAIKAPSGVESTCAIIFEYTSGQLSILDCSLNTETETEACIYGETGKLKLQSRFHHSKEINLIKHGKLTERFKLDYLGNGYFHEIQEVNNCLLNGKTESEKMPLSMSLQLIQILDKIRPLINVSYPSDTGSVSIDY